MSPGLKRILIFLSIGVIVVVAVYVVYVFFILFAFSEPFSTTYSKADLIENYKRKRTRFMSWSVT